ncbi:MAG: hypothetical protein CM15mP74_16340 [Halieaceae bacterium]|nr:MAG: hypothetical protein CM15mP74_16340 [Halieaceae bacterium]
MTMLRLEGLPMALWSTHEILPGPNPVNGSLTEGIPKGEEKRGFNNCAMYKHEFGSPALSILPAPLMTLIISRALWTAHRRLPLPIRYGSSARIWISSC